jgi:hypothetical protein
MAIEWNIYEPEPVSKLALVEASERFAERLLGEKLLDFTLSRTAASGADDGAEFDSEVFAVCGEATATAFVDLYSARIDDEGRPAEEAVTGRSSPRSGRRTDAPCCRRTCTYGRSESR